MRPPVWFADIDGVLAPMDRRQTGLTYRVVETDGWQGSVIVAVEIIRRFRALTMSGLVEVRWLTSWEQEAADHFAPKVGLPPLRVHTVADSLAPAGTWWKQGVVERFLAGSERRVIWTDDELADYGAGVPLGEQHRCLVIEPEPTVGLILADLARIEAWLGL